MAPAEELPEEEEEEAAAGEEAPAGEGPDEDGWLKLMDGNIQKRVLVEGTGPCPELKQDVLCSFQIFLADSPGEEPLQRRTRARFRVGEGEAVPCLELALRHMAQGEECEVRGISRMAWADEGLPAVAEGEREVPPDADVLLRVILEECLDMEGSNPSWNNRIQELTWRKESGNDYFRRRSFQRAVRSYTAGLEVFQGGFEPPDDLPNGAAAASAVAALCVDVGANLAAAHLELGRASAAKAAVTAALELNPDHVKGLYRAAKACFLLDEFQECEAALRRALSLEPENAAVKRLEAEFRRKRQRYEEKSKRVATKLFEGLQYPEPARPEAVEAKDQTALQAAAAWCWERRRYAAAAAAWCLLLLLLLAALPRKHWGPCIIAALLSFPVLAALASGPDEGAAKAAKPQKRA